MTRPTIDTDWAKDQFDRAGIHPNVQAAVLALIEKWEELDVLPEQTPEILETFLEIAQNHALLPGESEETWIEGFNGLFRTGDIVRVRHDAFEGSNGAYHNGRVGKVLAVRSGQVIFRSTDGRQPFIDGAHYQADKLEKRVK